MDFCGGGNPFLPLSAFRRVLSATHTLTPSPSPENTLTPGPSPRGRGEPDGWPIPLGVGTRQKPRAPVPAGLARRKYPHPPAPLPEGEGSRQKAIDKSVFFCMIKSTPSLGPDAGESVGGPPAADPHLPHCSGPWAPMITCIDEPRAAMRHALNITSGTPQLLCTVSSPFGRFGREF